MESEHVLEALIVHEAAPLVSTLADPLLDEVMPEIGCMHCRVQIAELMLRSMPEFVTEFVAKEAIRVWLATGDFHHLPPSLHRVAAGIAYTRNN